MIEPYQFHMIHRLEHMSRGERLEAEEQAGRMAQGVWNLGRALRRGAGALGRLALVSPLVRRSGHTY